jgi:hypothetical protein
MDGCLILFLVFGGLLLIAALRLGDRQSFVKAVHKNWQLLVLCAVPLGVLLTTALLLLHVPDESVFGRLETAKVDRAKADIVALTNAVHAFKLRTSNYPDSLEALVYPSIGKPLIAVESLLSPWGRPYQYDPNGPRNQGKKPDIWIEVSSTLTIGNFGRPQE